MAITSRVRATLGVCLTVAAVTLHGCAGRSSVAHSTWSSSTALSAGHPLDGAGAGRRSHLPGQLARERRPTGRRLACDPAHRAIRSPRRRQLEHARRRRRHRRPAGRSPPPVRRRRPSCSCCRRRIAKGRRFRPSLEAHASFASMIRTLAARRQPRRNRVGRRRGSACTPTTCLRCATARRRRRPKTAATPSSRRCRSTDLTAIELPFERQRRVAVGGDRCRGHQHAGRRGRCASCRRISTTWSARGACGSPAASSAATRQARGLVSALQGDDAARARRRSELVVRLPRRRLPRPPRRAFPETPVTDRRATFHGMLRLDHLFFRLDEGWRAQFCTRRRRLRIRSLSPPRRDPVRLTRYN